MLIATVRSYFSLPVICLFVFSTLFLQVNCKSYQTKDTHNKTSSHERNSKSFSQKKPRSAQVGFFPQYQPVYSQQSVPVRLSSIPASSYRLPGVQRLGNLASLARLPALQRTYIPVMASSIPASRYPSILQQDNRGAGGRYVLPYILKMPSTRLPTKEGINNPEFAKHYTEKYDTLPSVSNVNQDQDTVNQGGKIESKKIDLDDDFDHFLDSLDGPCSRNPCRNGAKCRISREGSSFHCICKRGYKGKTCADKNPCYQNPCQNDGECTLTRKGFECSCPKGYNGKKCEQKNKCEPNPCENDGICNEIKNGEFECTCKKGFFGEKCQVTKKGCRPNPCLHDGRCSEQDNGDYECTCTEGYTGKSCDSADNKCMNNPCKNGGSCLQAITSIGYECSCPRGFRGQNCEDHSGCELNSCQNGGTCYETDVSIRCICKNGYSGDKCQVRRFCDADTCQNNGKCVERVTGFHCKCSTGYKGKMCEEMDRCHPNPCLHRGECEQSETGYFCKCSSQYQGMNCEVQNPCSQNPCKNGGKCSADVNGVGYQCECDDGYRGHNCEERNACKPNPCGNNGVCRSRGDGFLCDCQKGFQGNHCQIKDPCRANPCQNGGNCKRSGETEYTCLCPEDFKGFHCEARKPCHPNPCMNDGVCDENGNDFTCSCREGFRGIKCEEQDQCFLNPCKNGGRCTSSSASNNGKAFTCECVDGFNGDTCQARNLCHPNPCMNDGTCDERDNDFACSCREGFRGTKCEEHDQCFLNPCKNGGRCTSLNPSTNGKAFTCECVNSFYGDTCEERNPCHPNPCANSGQCTEVNGGFTCQCSEGFKGDRCREIDKCNPSPCHHGGVCSQVIDGLGYACRCPYGYKGQDCEQKEHCHPNPCDHDGQCVALDNDEGFQCKCSYGFKGSRCSDVNPCEPNPCQHDSQCITLPGFAANHLCNCTIGWSGETCQKREICKPNPCQYGTKCVETGKDSYSCVKSMCHPSPCQNSGKCVNVNDNNFQCACTQDFEGKMCEVPRRRTNQLSYVPASPPSIYSQLPGGTNRTAIPNAQRINALAGKPPTLPMNTIASCSPSLCQNGGVCVQEQGKPIRCKCKISFTGETCEDNKCRRNPCLNDGMCLLVEREPGFVCKCRDGRTGPLCSRKPCEPNPCKNGGDCVIFYSVYLCKCKPGFNGKHCEDGTSSLKAQVTLKTQEKEIAQSSPSKDDRVSACNRKPCENNARCVESSDGEFQCICSNDFSGPRCEDEGNYKYSSAPKFFPGENEECKHCDKNARCVNAHCICRNKFVGDGLECWMKTQRDQQWSCDKDPCQNGGTCKPGISRCVCRLGYVGDYCEEYSPPVVTLKFEKLVDGRRLVDATGNGNDAVVFNGFQIASKQGKCENAGNMLGGDVLFDGQTFKGIPRRAITIAVWVKLTTSLGIQSIFDTIGSHSAHKDGQYHFEIDNGRVRWFHRNEMGKTVFSVVTDQPVITKGNWTLIIGTYSSMKNRTRIFINGDLIKEEKTRGMLLSGDWGAKAGIGKHEHPYGARVLRGMVDEFSIFPSELSRLQILVLMQHCKIYYNKITSKTDSAKELQVPQGPQGPQGPQETFTELPVTAPYPLTANQDMFSGQLLTTATRYPGYTATSSRPLQPNNYQPAQYQPPTNGYLRNRYYGNIAGSPDKPAITGYQKIYTLKSPVVPQYTTGSPRTIQPSKWGYNRPEAPKRPVLSPFAQGSYVSGIPTQAGYQKPKNPENPGVSPYALHVSPYAQGMPVEEGYVKTQISKGPVVNQYASGWTNTRKQEQVGSIRTQTPQLPIATPHAPTYYGGPSVSNPYQAQHNNDVPSYNGYITPPNQQPNAYYPTLQTPTGRSGGKYDVTGTGSTSQQTGSVRSQQHSAQVNPNNQVPYQSSQTNTVSEGVKYTSVPQPADTSAQYRTAQNVGTAWTGQYQTIVPSYRGQGGHYESLPTTGNTANSEYQPAAKGYLGNHNQPGSLTSWPQNTAPMTSSSDVRSTSYPSGLPSQPQNAYARRDFYPNQDNTAHKSVANNAYTKSLEAMSPGNRYPTSSIPQRDTSTNSFSTPSRMNSIEAMQSQVAHVNNQMLARDQVTNMANSQNSPPRAATRQGQVNGPIYNNNQFNPTYNRQVDNKGQYPSNVQRYKNVSNKSRTNDKGAYGRPLSRTFATSGANIEIPSSSASQWPGYSKEGDLGNSQMPSQTGYNSWSTAAQTPTGTDQWNPSDVPNAKIYQVGWTTQEAVKNTRGRYDMPQMMSRNQWRIPSLAEQPNQRLATTLALDQKPYGNSRLLQNQGLANDLAVDQPKVYKRSKINTHNRLNVSHVNPI